MIAAVAAVSIFPASINDVIISYETGEYATAILSGEEILKKSGEAMEKKDLINVETYLAFSYVAIGDTVNAQKYFENILMLDRNYSLNAEFVSPKIINVFNKSRERVNVLIQNSPDYYSVTKEAQASKYSRTNLLLKSLALPGWGQHDRGETVKSTAMGAIYIAGLAATVGSLVGTFDARSKYQQAETTDDAARLYDTYNNLSKLNRVSFDITLSLFIFNIYDILWSK